MMPGALVDKPPQLSDTRAGAKADISVLSRKIWLPRFVYDALPYFYLVAGLAALMATLYISEWFWVLPHYLLFSAACVHLALIVFLRRHRANQHEDADTAGGPPA